MTAVNIPDMY
jgi:hypothetical protein